MPTREELVAIVAQAVSEGKRRSRVETEAIVRSWKCQDDVLALLLPELRAGNVGAVIWRDMVSAKKDDAWLADLNKHVLLVSKGCCFLRITRVAGSPPCVVLILCLSIEESEQIEQRYDDCSLLPVARPIPQEPPVEPCRKGVGTDIGGAVPAPVATVAASPDDEWEQVCF